MCAVEACLMSYAVLSQIVVKGCISKIVLIKT